MLFNSLDFAIFFCSLMVLYPRLRHRGQNILLLVASYIFYGWWNWRYLALLVASALVDYTAGLRIAAARSRAGRRGWLIVSLGFNLSILSVFKYCDFFLSSAAALLGSLGLPADLPTLRLVLPVGISFFTFQSMSYAIDVYRGDTHARTYLPDYLLYVSFFPQMVAGPIERPGHLLGQLERPRAMTPEGVYAGLLRVLWGLFKKVAVADNLATYVDAAYVNYGHHGGLTLAFASYLFAFQIYCDFSGYSDIAIGLARILGVQLIENFRTPYFSENVQEFWHRWHISLSTWFRDYVYFPLGGNRARPARVIANTMIVFLVSGLWHGANWTFVVWGGLHGAYLVVLRWLPDWLTGAHGSTPRGAESAISRLTLPRALRILVTFHLVCLAWVFFRASSVEQAFQILATIATQPGTLYWDPLLANGLACLGMLVVTEAIMGRDPFDQWLIERRLWVHLVMACTVAGTIVLFSAQKGVQFIYFQF